MAFSRMIWKRAESGLRVKVRVKIKNTFNPSYVKRVRVNVSIKNYVQ